MESVDLSDQTDVITEDELVGQVDAYSSSSESEYESSTWEQVDTSPNEEEKGFVEKAFGSAISEPTTEANDTKYIAYREKMKLVGLLNLC